MYIYLASTRRHLCDTQNEEQKKQKKTGGWGAGNEASIQIQENLFIPYSQLILQGANFRVFPESGLIREIFFPAKILESNMWKKPSKSAVAKQSSSLPPFLMMSQHNREIFLGMCLTISLPFNTTTANGSFAFLRCCAHCSCSPTVAIQTALYVW